MNFSKIIECPENKQEITPQNRLFIQMRIPKKVSESLIFSYHDNVFESTTKCYNKINQISRINDDHLWRVCVFLLFGHFSLIKWTLIFLVYCTFRFIFVSIFIRIRFFFLLFFICWSIGWLNCFFSLRVYSNWICQ